MGLRDSKFIVWYYEKQSKLFLKILGRKRQKEFYEWLFWKFKKIKEKRLTNHHFEYFFTQYFGFTLEDYANKVILDIGCGPRGSLEWAKNTKERVGLDTLADRYVKMEGKYHQMKYVQGGAENIPFSDSYFDFISSFNSFDDLDDLKLSIQEIKRVLKPGGYFLLISDIHSHFTVYNPSSFSWDVVEKFKPEFTCLQEKHYEGNLMYKSIRQGIEFNHNDSTDRYGILTVLFQKN